MRVMDGCSHVKMRPSDKCRTTTSRCLDGDRKPMLVSGVGSTTNTRHKSLIVSRYSNDGGGRFLSFLNSAGYTGYTRRFVSVPLSDAGSIPARSNSRFYNMVNCERRGVIVEGCKRINSPQIPHTLRR